MKWHWRAYCTLILILGYGQMLRKILTDTGGFSSRYSAAIIATIVVVMLIAQANEKALGKVWFWQGLLLVLVLTAITSLLFAVYLTIIGIWLSAGLLLAATFGLAPSLIQLYQYSFNSPQLWQNSN